MEQATYSRSFWAAHSQNTTEDLDCDGEFEKLAATFFGELGGTRTVSEILQQLPAGLSCWSSVSLEQSLEMFKTDLKSVKHESLGAEDEVDVFVPLWRTMPLPLALVFDALAKAFVVADGDVMGFVQSCFEQSAPQKCWCSLARIRHPTPFLERRHLRPWSWKKSRPRIYNEMLAERDGKSRAPHLFSWLRRGQLSHSPMMGRTQPLQRG